MCKASPPTSIEADLKSASKTKSMVTFFRLGRMRFGFHGVFGILASITTWWALYDETLLSVLVSCFFSSLVSYWASQMMHLVPADTKIYKNIIVAPHVDAFTSTVYLVYYCNIRALRTFLPNDPSILVKLLYKGSLMMAYRPFISKRFSEWDFRNLNTWIFGIPRLLGVTCDFTKAFFGDSTISTHDLLFIVESLLLASFAYSVSFRIRGSPKHFWYHFVSRFVYVAITGMLGYLLYTICWPDFKDSLSQVARLRACYTGNQAGISSLETQDAAYLNDTGGVLLNHKLQSEVRYIEAQSCPWW